MTRLFLILTFPIAYLGALILGQRREVVPLWRELWRDVVEDEALSKKGQ